MNSAYNKVVRLFLPVGAIAGIAGIVQDLIVPLAQIGMWLGLVALGIGLVFLLIGEQSRLGVWLKGVSQHWKMPLVAAFLFLGVSILAMAEISAKYEEDNGYLASNYEVMEGVQATLLSIVGQANVIRDTAKETTAIIRNTGDNLDDTANNLRKTAEDKLHQLGHSVTDVEQIFRIFTGYQGDALKQRLQLLKDSEFNLTRSVRPYNYWGNAYAVRMNEVIRLPRRMRLADALVALELPHSVWRETLSYFPELLTDRSQSTRGYALEDYPYTRSDDIQYGWISIRNGATAPSHKDMRGGYTLLHTAVVLNSYTSADALLQLQADVNATTESGYTPLALASEHGTFDVAELLLQYGADAATDNWLAVEIALLRASLGISKQVFGNGLNATDYHPVERNESIRFATRLLNGNALPDDVKQRVIAYYRQLDSRLSPTQKQELKRYLSAIQQL